MTPNENLRVDSPESCDQCSEFEQVKSRAFVRESTAGLVRVEPDLDLPQIGDIQTMEGYVNRLVIDIPRFNPRPATDSTSPGNRNLENRTFLLAAISEKQDALFRAWEVRILHSSRAQEDLAVTMAVVASLKDAFFKKRRVRVWVELAEETIVHWPQNPEFRSDVYRKLRSVELLAE